MALYHEKAWTVGELIDELSKYEKTLPICFDIKHWHRVRLVEISQDELFNILDMRFDA